MRIARFTTGDDPQYGVITGDVDEFGQPADDSVVVALTGDPLYVGIEVTQEEHRLADVRLLAPVLPRSKVIGIGRNYAAHAAELGNEVPDEPLMFLKPNTSVIGPGEPIAYPSLTEDLHFEGELAVVIGRICRDVPAAQAHRRDLRLHDRQRRDRARPPALRRASSRGPRASTRSARSGRGSRPTSTRRRSPTASACRPTSTATLKQDGNTRDLIFDIPTLVATSRAVMTLLPGDVILTGTPAGVGPMAGRRRGRGVRRRPRHPDEPGGEAMTDPPSPCGSGSAPSPTGSPHVGLRPHRALQLGVRAPPRRHVRVPGRGHRQGALAPRSPTTRWSTPCAGSASTGTRAPRSADRTAPTGSPSATDLYRDVLAKLARVAARRYECYCTTDEVDRAPQGRRAPRCRGTTASAAS